MRHNHFTRDVKSPGECPGCDNKVIQDTEEPLAEAKLSTVEDSENIRRYMQHLHVEKLRRKPEHVEAVYWNPSLGWDYALKLAEWCGGKLSRDQLHPEKTYYWIIHLSEGWTYPNEWIVKNADGSFSVQTNEYMQDFESDSE